jgi:hypothetical protein
MGQNHTKSSYQSDTSLFPIKIIKARKLFDLYVITVVCPMCQSQFDTLINRPINQFQSILFPCRRCEVDVECDVSYIKQYLKRRSK